MLILGLKARYNEAGTIANLTQQNKLLMPHKNTHTGANGYKQISFMV